MPKYCTAEINKTAHKSAIAHDVEATNADRSSSRCTTVRPLPVGTLGGQHEMVGLSTTPRSTNELAFPHFGPPSERWPVPRNLPMDIATHCFELTRSRPLSRQKRHKLSSPSQANHQIHTSTNGTHYQMRRAKNQASHCSISNGPSTPPTLRVLPA